MFNGKKRLYVLISGKIEHGKDEMAKQMASVYTSLGVVFRLVGFSYYIKDQVAMITGTTVEENHTIEGKNKKIDMFGGKTLGMLQVEFGAHMRKFHNDSLINILMSSTREEGVVYIVPDCRFPNEIGLVKKNPENRVISIRVNRDKTKFKRISTRSETDISETALDDYREFDHVVENDGTLEEFRAKVRKLTIEKLLFTRGLYTDTESVVNALTGSPSSFESDIVNHLRKKGFHFTMEVFKKVFSDLRSRGIVMSGSNDKGNYYFISNFWYDKIVSNNGTPQEEKNDMVTT